MSYEIIKLFLFYDSNCDIRNNNKLSIYEIIDLIPKFYRSRVFDIFFSFELKKGQCVLKVTKEAYDDFNVHDSYQPHPSPPSA